MLIREWGGGGIACLPAYRRSLTKLDKWGKEWGRASGKGVVVVTTLARRHVPRCNLAGDKGGVRWNKAPRWLAGKETSFSYIRGHGQTTSFITHWPFDHRNTLAIRPTVRASFPLSPPPLFRSISTTAFNRSRPPRVRPPRWTKKKKTHHPCFIHRIFSNRFDYSRPISRGIWKGKERFEDYFFFFFTLRRTSPLPVDTGKSGWHRRLRVTKSHPPNPRIESVVVHTCRLFNDEGKRTTGKIIFLSPTFLRLYGDFRRLY